MSTWQAGAASSPLLAGARVLPKTSLLARAALDRTLPAERGKRTKKTAATMMLTTMLSKKITQIKVDYWWLLR